MSFAIKPIKFNFGKKKNPFDAVEYTGNAEADSLAEMSEIEKGFKQRAKEENQRFADATDSEYWVALCFQTREQKEEFLEKLKLIQLGDKYLDGLKVAKQLGVEIESPTPKSRKFKQDNSWNEFVD